MYYSNLCFVKCGVTCFIKKTVDIKHSIAPTKYTQLNDECSAINPLDTSPMPMPVSHDVRYVLVAVARRLCGAREINSELYAGKSMPNPTP